MKTALYYVVLVGLPFLGLLGILEAGSRITPPRSIGGVWDVEPAGQPLPACLQTLFGGAPRELRIDQSGVRAAVTFNERAAGSFSIDVAADSISGALPASETQGCPAETLLRAVVSSEAGRDILRGALSTPGCAECTVSLQATRRARQGRG